MRWWWKDAYCTFVLGIFRSQTEITHSYYLVQPFCTRGHWGFQATEFWYLASEDLVMVVMVDKSALPRFPYALYLCASKVSFCFLIPEKIVPAVRCAKMYWCIHITLFWLSSLHLQEILWNPNLWVHSSEWWEQLRWAVCPLEGLSKQL